MEPSKRRLAVGLVGIAMLLISVLVYAQINAAHNYEGPEVQSGTQLPSVNATTASSD